MKESLIVEVERELIESDLKVNKFISKLVRSKSSNEVSSKKEFINLNNNFLMEVVTMVSK
jgi:predicted ThiF/HesA family dinucleotide-utilizing enzyme